MARLKGVRWLVTIKEPKVAKKLSCWFGRHDLTTRVEQGESYKVCSNCGKTPRGVRGDIRGPGSGTGPGGAGGPDGGVDAGGG